MGRTMEVSAGLLVFRRRNGLEVLLGHPGGPFWARKDSGAWTIPKGLVDPGEDILAAARREFTEETNLVADGEMIALGPVNQKSGKTVHAFACKADFDLATFASNAFEIEWPPASPISRCRSPCPRYFPINSRCCASSNSVSADRRHRGRYSRGISGQSTSSCGSTHGSRRAASRHSPQAGSAIITRM